MAAGLRVAPYSFLSIFHSWDRQGKARGLLNFHFFLLNLIPNETMGLYFFFLSLLYKDNVARYWSEISNYQGSGVTEIRYLCGS